MMFAVTTPNNTYGLYFRYDEDKQKRRTTQCVVMDKEENLVGAGKVTCSKEDIFSKVIGRKAALARALSNLSKDERTLIWKVYMENFKYK